MARYTSVEHVFEEVARRFDAGAAGAADGIVSFDLDGAGRYWVAVERGACRVGRDQPPRPAQATVRCSGQDWLRVANGEQNPVLAALMGRIRVDGDLELALKLARGLPRD